MGFLLKLHLKKKEKRLYKWIKSALLSSSESFVIVATRNFHALSHSKSTIQNTKAKGKEWNHEAVDRISALRVSLGLGSGLIAFQVGGKKKKVESWYRCQSQPANQTGRKKSSPVTPSPAGPRPPIYSLFLSSSSAGLLGLEPGLACVRHVLARLRPGQVTSSSPSRHPGTGGHF